MRGSSNDYLYDKTKQFNWCSSLKQEDFRSQYTVQHFPKTQCEKSYVQGFDLMSTNSLMLYLEGKKLHSFKSQK